MGLKQVTRYVNLSERTVRSWIHERIDPLPAARVGGKILIRRSQLDAWLERRGIQPLTGLDLDAIMREVMGGAGNGR
jgi:excisionase family DNA binding protein